MASVPELSDTESFSKPRDTRGFGLSGNLAEKKYSDEMVGDALREAGTLVVVFAPLYVIFEKSDADWYTVVSALLCRSGAADVRHRS
ncbi:hypothetical protein SBA7_700016 [Candidatus Sulfotelmatobacter sp. SbA7]|nr:hypothetical protein SBA7_700016 [Candidatus Sulfotelmatobacter sp. SbA7]